MPDTSVGDGTYFLQEYMIPKSSTSFCLYDARSLSDDSSDNAEMLKRWMTKGVRHGDPISRSDFWKSCIFYIWGLIFVYYLIVSLLQIAYQGF